MKSVMLAMALAAAWFISFQSGQAQTNDNSSTLANDTSAKKLVRWTDLTSELNVATAHLKDKFSESKTNAANFADNQREVEELIRKYAATGNREQVARLYLLDAHIYADGLTNTAKAQAIWVQIIRDFPKTAAAKGASISLGKVIAVAPDDSKVAEGLEIGQRFPNFLMNDASGNLLSPKAYRGKILMIDFWATWCPPCRGEMPNVIATYRKYHTQGFDIIGVSLDEDVAAMAKFTAANGMPWQQYCDGLGWKNELATKYNIQSIPMDYVLDGNGIIIGKDLREEELGETVEQALNKK